MAMTGDPPVCKIIDYGKYKYAVEKRKKENLKKQSKSEIKEVKMSYKIDQHDFDVRLRAVQRFIQDGDRVSGPF
jgi:translation initiation factor IF-3